MATKSAWSVLTQQQLLFYNNTVHQHDQAVTGNLRFNPADGPIILPPGGPLAVTTIGQQIVVIMKKIQKMQRFGQLLLLHASLHNNLPAC
jgi:hypothetical protein